MVAFKDMSGLELQSSLEHQLLEPGTLLKWSWDGNSIDKWLCVRFHVSTKPSKGMFNPANKYPLGLADNKQQ